MDSDDEYDEFGNYLGQDIGSNSDEGENSEVEDHIDEGGDENVENDIEMEAAEETEEMGIVKGNSLAQTFGDAETILVDPLLQGKDEPIIKNVEEKKLHAEYDVDQDNLPEVTYSREYMAQISKELPERIRNVAFVGNLHTGKTSLIDLIVQQTHIGVSAAKKELQEFKPLRYLDTHKLETERGLTIGSKFVSLLVLDSRDRSHIFNLADCPGHPDFNDEVDTTLAVVEGAVLVIDVLEGLTKRDKRLLTALIKKNLPFLLVLNKFDRLILELRLPPSDFYHKVKYILDDINAFVYHNEYIATYTHEKLVSPLKNNVVFSSTNLQTCFTLLTFAEIYIRKYGAIPGLASHQLEKLLWGDFYMDKKARRFAKFVPGDTNTRTFEQFVLEPLYKLVTYSLTSDPDGLQLASILWDNFGLTLSKSSRNRDPQTLLRDVFNLVFDSTSDFATLIVATIPDPSETLDSVMLAKGIHIEAFDKNGVIGEVLKLILAADKKSQYAVVRVYQGTLTIGTKLRVVQGDTESEEDHVVEVKELYIPGGRYKVAVGEVPAGNIAILGGISAPINKTASIFGSNIDRKLCKPFHFARCGEKSIYKVAVEPELPLELPILLDGLTILSKCYLSAVVHTEENGEHVLLAPGELYLDCFLHDLRYIFADYLSIKVSDPMAKFSETCSERSVTKITTYGFNKKNLLSITAEPLKDRNLSRAIESGQINLSQPQKTTAKILRNDYGWDALAARSLWCFGPDDMQAPSMLLDDTLEEDTNKQDLLECKDLICAGFKLAVNEGPLCDEPIRNTKFKILDAVLNGSNLSSSSSHFIPITRNAVHTGFLTASPKLMEPTYRVNIMCTYKSVEAVQTILGKRRGWTVSETPVPATPLYEIEGYVPMIESSGLDTDLRLYTQGQAMGILEFARWDIVPGDPLDQDCVLPALKPVPRNSLARDFVMKTRRRKGLSGEPNLQRYLDADLYARLRDSGVIN